MCFYEVAKDIIIPIVSAIIGGAITLIGVQQTIKNENKKAQQDYLERIRPFFVIETYKTLDLQKNTIKDTYTVKTFEDDYQGNRVIRWDGLLLSNVSDNVSIIGYVRIDNTKYNCLSMVPVKPGEFCEIHPTVFPILTQNSVSSISIGVYDRLFNLYEYTLSFEIERCDEKLRIGKYDTKRIVYSSIDCSKNLAER